MVALCAAVLLVGTACGDDPVAVELQVIEEVEFAPSLGIDLAAFTGLPSGVYVQDVVVGVGGAAEAGSEVTLEYTGYLTDGTVFDPGDLPLVFVLGSGAVIHGFDEGVRGMQLGGERRMIVPPELAYGTQERTRDGAVIIPAGSILIFDVTLTGVS
jgi:FKBP-type peptidyl-prolyl cis-trans isomerase FkpA